MRLNIINLTLFLYNLILSCTVVSIPYRERLIVLFPAQKVYIMTLY